MAQVPDISGLANIAIVTPKALPYETSAKADGHQ
jgi:hypothetical protein